MGKPMPLLSNKGKSFIGSYVLGLGFVLSHEQANELIRKDPRNKDVIFPYLNGDDLNSDPEQKPSRWVINFFEWDEKTAKSYPDCYNIIEQNVKPERLTKNDQRGREKWWQFLRVRRELYNAISELDQVIVLPRVSKYFVVSIAQKNIVYSEATVVIALGSFSSYAILSSVVHEIWAWKNSSTMKGDALRYSASRAFETFPFPSNSPQLLEELGHNLYLLRKELMLKYKIGLTDLLNIYHNKELKLSSIYFNDILRLRKLQEKIDFFVCAAYGWEYIVLEHNFQIIEYLPINDRIRYTIDLNARKIILNKLSSLNLKEQIIQSTSQLKINERKQKTKFNSLNLFSEKDF
ncbi:hypothetical protein OZ663_03685 [Elizabethkingia sp. HX CGY]|nr:type IIL restriction-modification enzyme MmeI [Elizabethkingia sp. HX CGY]MCT3765546.1 hypothetical protein [Elizabethkingia anophelis]MCT4160775.1 hypothetical protein [Elizabethkingia anophelis]MDX8555750.1 hypothetical protein [Elizabethkingia sp. HX CGY]